MSTNLSDTSNNDKLTVVQGYITSSRSRMDLANYRIAAYASGRQVADTSSSTTGGFALRLPADLSMPDDVHLAAYHPSGVRIAEMPLNSDGAGFARGIEMPAPAIVYPRSILSREQLSDFYQAISWTAQSGYFKKHHGVIEDTAWFHICERELEGFEDLSARVARGETNMIPVLRGVLEGTERLSLEAAGDAHIPAPAESVMVVRPHYPVSVVVAATLLDQLEEHGSVWTERALVYYLRRIGALNHALHHTTELLTRTTTPSAFVAHFDELRRMLMPEDPDHSPDQEHSHHGGAAVTFSISGVDPAVQLFSQRLIRIARMAREMRMAADFPITLGETHTNRTAEGSLEITILPAAGCRFPERQPALTADSGLFVYDGEASLRPAIRQWSPHKITLSFPGNPGAGEAGLYWQAPTPSLLLRVSAHLRKAVPEGVEPLSDNPAFTPRESLVQFSAILIGEFAPGYDGYDPGAARNQMLVDNEPREDGKPDDDDADQLAPAEPQIGGKWETARVNAIEQAELCPPAESLSKASEAVYGWSGQMLTEAVNHVTEAGRCYGKAGDGARKCKQKRDEGYEHCDVEEDQGYNECSKKEDRGHEECCDWWPCSWACDALVWIANIVCVVWTWISHWVCIASHWIAHWVCVAWEYTKATVCAAWHGANAFAKGLLGLGGIGVAAGLRNGAKFVNGVCTIFGVRGSMTQSDSLKIVGVHIAVLHTGKVLLFNYDEGNQPVKPGRPADPTRVADSNRALCALWDPRTGDARYLKLRRNLFCSHHSFLGNGRLFVVGGQFPLPDLGTYSAVAVAGILLFNPAVLSSAVLVALGLNALSELAPGADKDIHVFDPEKEEWRRLPDIELGRWYPTCVTLANGEVFFLSGTNGYATESGFGRGIQDTCQIYNPATGTVSPKEDLPFQLHHLYPFLLALPRGQVFIHSHRKTVLFDPAKPPGDSGRFDQSLVPLETNWPFSRTGGGPGVCCLLPLKPKRVERDGNGNITVVYPRGKVLIVGGGGAEKVPEDGEISGEDYNLRSETPATKTAEIIDFDDEKPQWKYIGSMHSRRVMTDAILLPDGKVLITGGGRNGQSGGLLAHFKGVGKGAEGKGALGPVLAPERLDPEKITTDLTTLAALSKTPVRERNGWSVMCKKIFARLYHTTALLLPDGRVLVAGHDGHLNMLPYDTSRYELELYSPPYLFRGPRPNILAAPVTIRYAQQFFIQSDDAMRIQSVAIIRQGSTTHQTNSDQRYVGLAILERTENSLKVIAPPNGWVAPPGYYMLFILTEDEIPSTGHWIRLGTGGGRLG
jgi:hypothetical protein